MPKRLSNQEIAQILKEHVAAMEVKGYSFFRIRAYQTAISAIENLTMSVYDLWEKDRLSEIPGVGESLEQHLTSLFEKGSYPEAELAKRDLPEGMFALIGIRGIGAKRAYKLAEAFDLQDRASALETVKQAAQDKKIQALEGFGEKIETQILEAISELKKTKNERKRMLLFQAEEIAQRIITYLEKPSYIQKAEALGSLKRREDTVGDLDIAVATSEPDKALRHFLDFPEIAEIVAEGEKKVSVNLTNGTQVDIRVVEPNQYGSMVQYFTGSKQHNIVLRTYALEKGYSLSEYGIKDNGTLHEFATEKEFYNFLGLEHIPPQIRQGKNEVTLAARHELPVLVDYSDIKGDLHVHTIASSDAVNTLSEMVKAGIDLGYEYIGIADHAPSVQTRSYEEVAQLIAKQRAAIDELNAAQTNIKVLFGYEVNILADANLSLPIEFLEQLDYVVAGIHTAFDQSREEITHRLVAAIRNPFVTIISHPTGRLLNEREGIDADWHLVFEEAAKHNKILELNAYPVRLDLPADLANEAKNMGVKLIIDTDAHELSQLYLMPYGVDLAKRAWCTKDDIVNTQGWKDFETTVLNR